jgi:predicted MPP superfamily phosphohydrolase
LAKAFDKFLFANATSVANCLSAMLKIFIVSDIHYACEAEQARRHHEIRAIRSRFGKVTIQLYRDLIWLKNPYFQNHLLDYFLEQTQGADLVIANGDYTCNTAFVGVSDDAACESARLCLSKLRGKFDEKFHAIFGDHELGKFSLIGKQGGLRVASYHTAVRQLGLKPFWRLEMGRYVFIGVTSSLIAFPSLEAESLPEERAEWMKLRTEHLAEIAKAFSELDPKQKVILFCHDPTALPFLGEEPAVREKIPQIERTIIGHLHSPFVFWKSGLLAGMPVISFLGSSIRKYSRALRDARYWRPFKVTLCPSPAGIELFKDGGFLILHLDPTGNEPSRIEKRKVPR